ncbi:MAG: beta-lactamase family protein [Caldilineales bacterium]|nr:beta-lactamase family protein [Caldilineales bacterium]
MNDIFSVAADASAAGMSPGGIREIETIFDRHFAEGLHPGGHLLVVRNAQIVVDRMVGLADPASRRPVRPDTVWLLFSATKPYAAVAILKLATEGRLDLDAPVAYYWPEFGQKGKQAITVRHVLTHRGGVPLGKLFRQPWIWPFWRLSARAIARMEPEYPCGEVVAYHALNFGYILGEVVHRVDGRSLRRYLKEELFQPMGLHDTYLGIPHRSDVWRRRSMVRAIDDETELNQAQFIAARRLFRTASIPAASGHSTIYEHAQLYQLLLNGGEWRGKQLLSPEVPEILVTPSNPEPCQIDRVTERATRWGHGVSLGGSIRSGHRSFLGRASGPRAFGHGGLRSHAAWADLDRQLICAYFTNGLVASDRADERAAEISDAVLAACL